MKIIDCLITHSSPFFSLEFFPPKNPSDWPQFFAVVEKLKAIRPLFVSVTCGAGGSTQAYTLEIASRLKNDHGLETMPHLTCVGASQESVLQALDEFHAAGIDNVMALRGDKPQDSGEGWTLGEFQHADDLVRYMREQRPTFGVGVAGYPAPHPESPSFKEDRDRLVEKIQTGADMVVTQLFFDCREYFELVRYLRAKGLNVPVIPGILPIQSMSSLKRTLSMCGANIPGNIYLELEKLQEKGGNEAVTEAGVNFAVKQIRQLLDGGAPGVHLYTLNKAELCLRIVKEVGQA